VVNQEYAELAELAGGFVHDLKNHLSTLRLNLQLLAEDFQDPQSQRERRALDRILRLQNECQRLVDISNEFLRFARVKDLELVPANLADVVEELTDFFGPMARAANIEIKSYIPADLPLVALNRDMFKQALLNLLLNAQQAMPNGGQITLLARTEPEGVVFELIDTGRGMSPEVLAKAFRPFYSTRSGGSGLGLPTTRKIIEAHGGTIDVQSELGHGTKFTIRLPALAEAGKTAATEESRHESHE
jgi:two-component system sensor histidine kinase HydH